MYQIYSFIEKEGKPFVPPLMKGEKAEPPEYLMQFKGRHYVSVKGKLPKQPHEIDCQGPIDLTLAENAELAKELEENSYPAKRGKEDRKREYPDLAEQIGAIMGEFAARAAAGEKLTPKLAALIGKVQEVKTKYPKEIKGVKESLQKKKG